MHKIESSAVTILREKIKTCLELLYSFCRNRILPKRLNVRIEHVKHSNCRLAFLRRVKENDEKKKAAKEQGIKVSLKRQVHALALFTSL